MILSSSSSTTTGNSTISSKRPKYGIIVNQLSSVPFFASNSSHYSKTIPENITFNVRNIAGDLWVVITCWWFMGQQ
jgi:hypothetical protein